MQKRKKAKEAASTLWNQKLQESYARKGKSHEVKRK